MVELLLISNILVSQLICFYVHHIGLASAPATNTMMMKNQNSTLTMSNRYVKLLVQNFITRWQSADLVQFLAQVVLLHK